jgi:hypothetical protein
LLAYPNYGTKGESEMTTEQDLNKARMAVRYAVPEYEHALRQKVDKLVDEYGWKALATAAGLPLDIFYQFARDRKVVVLRELFMSLGMSKQKAIETVFIVCVPHLSSVEHRTANGYPTDLFEDRIAAMDIEQIAAQMRRRLGFGVSNKTAIVAAHITCGSYAFENKE